MRRRWDRRASRSCGSYSIHSTKTSPSAACTAALRFVVAPALFGVGADGSCGFGFGGVRLGVLARKLSVLALGSGERGGFFLLLPPSGRGDLGGCGGGGDMEE